MLQVDIIHTLINWYDGGGCGGDDNGGYGFYDSDNDGTCWEGDCNYNDNCKCIPVVQSTVYMYMKATVLYVHVHVHVYTLYCMLNLQAMKKILHHK